MLAKPAKTLLIAVWLALSLPLSWVVLAPFLLPADAIYGAAPGGWEEDPETGEGAMRGMTTAFIMIGHGMLDDAWEANRASLPLFSFLVWNECAALWFVITAICHMLPRRRVRVVYRSDQESRAEERRSSCRS